MQARSSIKKTLFGFIIVFIIFSGLIFPVSAYDLSEELSGILESSNRSITLFYNQYCGSCKAAVPRVTGISEIYPELDIRIFNTYNSTGNRILLMAFGEKYNCSYPGVPIVFAGEMTVLKGPSQIDNHVAEVAKALLSGEVPSRFYEARWLVGESLHVAESVDSNTTAIPYSLIAGAGLLDGINPCAFAVLVFLLAGLMAAGSRRKMIFTGISYTTGVFVFYFLSGLGIFAAVQTAGIVEIFTFVAAAVALAAGIIQVGDGIGGKRIIRIVMPHAAGERLKHFASKASVLSAFVMGMGVGIFELPCTGGIYIAILGMLSSSVTFAEGIFYLLLYNLMFILPLIMITIGVAFGLPPEKIEEWRVRNRNILKIIMGAVLIGLGFFLILTGLFIQL